MSLRKHVQTQEEWEAEMSVKILGYVRDALYLDLRFLGAALSALVPLSDRSLHTTATDGQTLYYSSEQLIRVFRSNERYLNRLYLHTVFHCLFQHLWIGGNRDRGLWHLACDIAVEYAIDRLDKPSVNRILAWVRQELYQELEQEESGISAAVIYRVLLEKEEEELLALQQEFFADDHRYWPKEEKQQAAMQKQGRQWSRMARQAQLQQKRQGQDPAEGEKLLAEQVKAARGRRSYREFLEKFAVFREELQCDPEEFDLNFYTYGLRLYRNMPLVEPTESREDRKIQDFVIVIDTSGSTSGELVQGFLRETLEILSRRNNFFHTARIRILQCDEKIQQDLLVTREEQLEELFSHFELSGGGGTDFRPAFAYVDQLLEQGELENLCGLLYFTDGKGTYPQTKPAYRTAFLFLEDYEEEKVPAWAIRLRLEKEEIAGYEY